MLSIDMNWRGNKCYTTYSSFDNNLYPIFVFFFAIIHLLFDWIMIIIWFLWKHLSLFISVRDAQFFKFPHDFECQLFTNLCRILPFYHIFGIFIVLRFSVDFFKLWPQHLCKEIRCRRENCKRISFPPIFHSILSFYVRLEFRYAFRYILHVK